MVVLGGVCRLPDQWATRGNRYRSSHASQQIGIDCKGASIDVFGSIYLLHEGGFRCCAGIMTTGEIPMSTDYEAVDNCLFIREGDELKPDPLVDDLALTIDTDSGLVVILGCAYRGMISTLRHARTKTGQEMVNAVIGGVNLIGTSEERLERTID